MAFKRKTAECDRTTEIETTERKTEVSFDAWIVVLEKHCRQDLKRVTERGSQGVYSTILSSAPPPKQQVLIVFSSPIWDKHLDLGVRKLQGFSWNPSRVYHYAQGLFLLCESAIYPPAVGVQHLWPDKHFPRALTSSRPSDNSREICSNGSLSQRFRNCPFGKLSGMQPAGLGWFVLQ